MVRTFVKASTNGAKKQPENLSLTKLTRFCRMSSHCRLPKTIGGELQWRLRYSARTAVDWMYTRPGFMPVLESPMPITEQSINKHAFPRSVRDCRNWLNGLGSIPVRKCAWNLQASIGYLCSMFLNRVAGWYWRIPSTPSRRRGTKPTVRMQNGSVIYLCVI